MITYTRTAYGLIMYNVETGISLLVDESEN